MAYTKGMTYKKIIYITLSVLVVLMIVGVFSLNIYLDHQKKLPFIATAAEQKELRFYQQSEQWFIDHLKQAPIQIDGQRLDPKTQYMLEQMGDSTELQSYLEKIFTVPLGRKYLRDQVDRQWNLYAKPSQPMQQTIDLQVIGRDKNIIPIRVYIPQITDKSQKIPVLIYAHGGGYLFASVKALDRAVRLLANEAKVIVISIDYRLAPEYAYPAASNDGEDVFLWAKQHVTEFNGDPKSVAFGGDSAGGHIAINVAQRQIAAHQPPPKMLLLYYPATGLPFNDRSYQLFAKGYGLDATFFEYLLTKLFPDQPLDAIQPNDYMNPLQSKSLKDMPRTILATAGFDILRDSGAKFAQQLEADQVPVTYINYSSLTHSFLQFSGVIADAEQAATETAVLFGQQIRLKE